MRDVFQDLHTVAVSVVAIAGEVLEPLGTFFNVSDFSHDTVRSTGLLTALELRVGC